MTLSLCNEKICPYAQKLVQATKIGTLANSEHILCHSIMKDLEDNQILNNFQYGFRPAHSCEAQLITLVAMH